MNSGRRKYYPPHNSSIANTSAHWIVLVAYLGPILIGWIPEVGGLLSWILPLAILLMEKESLLVRFSAAQSFMLSLSVAVINAILLVLAISVGIFTFGLGAILIALIGLVFSLVVWLIEVYAAYQGVAKWTAWEIPFVGGLAHKLEQAVGKQKR